MVEENSILLIVNPVAGKGQTSFSLFRIMSELCSEGRAVTTYMTDGPGKAFSLAREHGPDFGTLVCVGGDGTLSEIIGGLMQIPQEKRPYIGYIPMGTANDMAATLKLSKTPSEAARCILEGKPRDLDVGRLCDKYFGYVAAFGAFTEVSYTTPQDTKRAFGHFAYLLEGMASLTRIKYYHSKIEYDNGVLEGDYVFGAVTNSTSIAGLVRLDPSDVGLSDGLFEVILVKNPRRLGDLSRIFNGVLTNNYDNENVIFLHTKNIRFTFDNPVAWTCDGESGGSFTVADAENLNRAVKIIV
jgi:diacylglycerol kinase (ATP)